MDDLFKKYRMTIAKNGQHYYSEDLMERDYSLECTTPIKFVYKTFSIENSSWKAMMPAIVNYFFLISNKSKNEALNLRTDWTKQAYFYESKIKSNLILLDNGLLLNGNFTAPHSVRCLQDLLDFFEIKRSECTLIIHRPSNAEPIEIQNFFRKERQEKFKVYLHTLYQYDDKRCNKIINNIDYLSKKYLSNFSKSYCDFFLFDSYNAFLTYKAKMLDFIKEQDNEKMMRQVERYMVFLQGLYSALY